MENKERLRKLEIAREKRAQLKEPRDWSIWWAYLIHAVQGMITGYFAVIGVMDNNIPLSLFAVLIVWQYLQYQHSSFLRKMDPVGRDIKDFAYGFVVGSMATYIFIDLINGG